MKPELRFCPAFALIFALLTVGSNVDAQQYNALAECRAQSLDIDRIHGCMDGYLDILDGNMQGINDFLGKSLSGDSLAGLARSQQAFDDYRRENCLWYLEFSSPRDVAEQIAKNCLADMTRARLQELQDLVTANKQTRQTITGFYVYDEERNTFQPCGSTDRYWVQGEDGTVDLLQRSYQTVASGNRQLMHSVLVGKLDNQMEAPDGHQGVLQLDALIEVREPTDSDCVLPDRPFNIDASISDVEAPGNLREVFDDERPEPEEPEQQITAYFGAWTVDCIELSGRRSCSLDVDLSPEGSEAPMIGDDRSPRMVLNRAPRKSTFIQVIFPGREIDSPSLVSWQVDERTLGDIVGSKIRVDQTEAQVLVSENEFLNEELMPLLLAGQQVVFSVQKQLDDRDGDVFVGTLKGLTKSLAFADDFVRDNG